MSADISGNGGEVKGLVSNRSGCLIDVSINEVKGLVSDRSGCIVNVIGVEDDGVVVDPHVGRSRNSYVEEIPEFRIDAFDVAGDDDLLGLVCDDEIFVPDKLGGPYVGVGAKSELFGKINLGAPELLLSRVSVVVERDGGDVDILVIGDEYWEKLSQHVTIDTDLCTRVEYAKVYDIEVPVAVVEVGPQCVTPVFQSCIEGVCDCTYTLCGAACQLIPCRFTAAVMGFGDDVDFDDAYVLTCAYRGVRIVDHNCPSAYYCDNYSTITGKRFSQEMNEKLCDELSENKVRIVENKPRCVHALGGIEKANGKLRPITDCSKPDGVNINVYMDTTCEKFRYKTVDTVVSLMYPFEYGAVSDIASAYRTIHVTPSHRTYQGCAWNFGEGRVYMEDLRLCFGLRSAPYAFTQFSNFVVKCCNIQGAGRCVNYLDDFVVLGGSEGECQESQDILHSMLINFGFKVAEDKGSPPSQRFKYLGIIIDTVKMTVSIDEDKLTRVKKEVLELLGKHIVKRKTLEEVAGLLAHCAAVVRGGRTFARRIYNALRDNSGPMVELDEVIKQDLVWWSSFVHWFNGRARVLGAGHDKLEVFTDSSNYGFGSHIPDDYFWGVWGAEAVNCPHSENPPLIDKFDDHINITELWPVVVAVHRWGVRFRNSGIMIVTDNTQVQSWVNTGRSTNPYAMAWLREIFWVAAFFNLEVKACRISSKDNVLADALSRLNSEDCNLICCAHFEQFSNCCRVARAAGGMG